MKMVDLRTCEKCGKEYDMESFAVKVKNLSFSVRSFICQECASKDEYVEEIIV